MDAGLTWDKQFEKDDRLPMDIKNALLSTPICQSLDKTVELDMLIRHGKLVTFSPGDVILQQGKNDIGMYIILDGTALVTAKILGEGGTYIATLGHGNIVGEISLLDEGPSSTSVIASTQVHAFLITNAFFEMLSYFYPAIKYQIVYAIAHEICNRLKDIHNKIGNYINHSDMVSRSIFGEVIKSLTKPTVINSSEADISGDEIKNIPALRTLSEDELRLLIENATFLKAPNHCTIIAEEEKDDHAFILLRGAVQSSIVQNNKFAKLSVLGPNSLFCSIHCIEKDSGSIVNYTTCERVLLLKLPTVNWLQTHNEILWFKIFNLFANSLVALERAADKLDIRLNSELYNR